jgi:hypothetical protein
VALADFTPRDSNQQLADCLWHSARGVDLVACHPYGSLVDALDIEKKPGQMAESSDALPVTRVRASASAVAAPEAGNVSHLLKAGGQSFIGVEAPAGEVTFVARGVALAVSVCFGSVAEDVVLSSARLRAKPAINGRAVQ